MIALNKYPPSPSLPYVIHPLIFIHTLLVLGLHHFIAMYGKENKKDVAPQEPTPSIFKVKTQVHTVIQILLFSCGHEK